MHDGSKISYRFCGHYWSNNNLYHHDVYSGWVTVDAPREELSLLGVLVRPLRHNTTGWRVLTTEGILEGGREVAPHPTDRSPVSTESRGAASPGKEE